MAKVIALITQVDASGNSHLPNEIFEVEDEAKLSQLICNKCVELYEEVVLIEEPIKVKTK